MSQLLEDTPWANLHIANDLGGLRRDSILPYFANSHFSDQTSNNAILLSQAQYDPELAAIVSTAESFQTYLQSMTGLEYLIAPDPARSERASKISARDSQTLAGQEPSVWVVQKQERQNFSDAQDAVKVLACYQILNGVITKLPTLGSVLAARLSSSLLPLNRALKSLVELPMLQPDGSYGYLPADYDPDAYSASDAEDLDRMPGLQLAPATAGMDTPPASQHASGTTSPASSLRRSQGVISNANLPKKQNVSVDDLFADSLRMMTKYRGVYMDEYPLVGEPGSFRVKGMEKQEEVRSQPKAPPRPINVALPKVGNP